MLSPMAFQATSYENRFDLFAEEILAMSFCCTLVGGRKDGDANESAQQETQWTCELCAALCSRWINKAYYKVWLRRLQQLFACSHGLTFRSLLACSKLYSTLQQMTATREPSPVSHDKPSGPLDTMTPLPSNVFLVTCVNETKVIPLRIESEQVALGRRSGKNCTLTSKLYVVQMDWNYRLRHTYRISKLRCERGPKSRCQSASAMSSSARWLLSRLPPSRC